MKKLITKSMEWVRPIGLALVYFFAYYLGKDAVSIFHILGPAIVVIMSGTVSFESLFLGEVASEKVGYKPNRTYQIQSGLNNLATAITAVFVLAFGWGKYADATVVITMLLFFIFSSVNHAVTAVKDHNLKPVNLMRPIMTLILLCFLLPPMINALMQ